MYYLVAQVYTYTVTSHKLYLDPNLIGILVQEKFLKITQHSSKNLPSFRNKQANCVEAAREGAGQCQQGAGNSAIFAKINYIRPLGCWGGS